MQVFRTKVIAFGQFLKNFENSFPLGGQPPSFGVEFCLERIGRVLRDHGIIKKSGLLRI